MSDQSTSGEGRGARVSPRSPSEAIQPEPAPAPPASRRARHPFVVALSALFTLMLLAVLGAGATLYIGSMQFTAAGPLERPQTVNIPRGQGTVSIGRLLESEGVIDNAWVFVGGVALNRARGRLQAGEYLFPEHASMADVMATMVEGNAILHQFTVPEGHTSAQIVMRLEANPVLTGEIADIPPEGSLLPETYRFTRGTTRQQMIERMQTAQAVALQEVWDRRTGDLPFDSPEELVNLAAIVEKETGRADERPRVASVFINRLRRDMRLQSDPTILYGLYGGEAFLEPRTITRSELDEPNEFSTYQITGLPPTPIANPGRAAMEAVANPSRTSELYFVADGSGGHAFAETLDEHNRNVARWRQIENERREAAAAAEESGEADDADNEATDAD